MDKQDFPFQDYNLLDDEGQFVATLDFKYKGKKNNYVVYFTLENQKKVVASAFENKNYLGVPDISIGSDVVVEFKKSSTGNNYLRSIELLKR